MNAFIHCLKHAYLLLLAVLFTLAALPVEAREKITLTLLSGSGSSHAISQTLSDLAQTPEILKSAELYYFTEEDLAKGSIDQRVIDRSRVIILDDMHKTLVEFATAHANFKTTKVFGLSPTDTPQIISDPKVKAYARPLTQKTISNLICFLLNREAGIDIAWEPPRAVSSSLVSVENFVLRVSFRVCSGA
ncbi:MAG: hypothetical protein KKC20_00865 [Proteobacteria bacterium]|nr:hypothetical protein [Pseudomonadota bacterium]